MSRLLGARVTRADVSDRSAILIVLSGKGKARLPASVQAHTVWTST